MKQISVLGCGWLGLPLAKHFIETGYDVNGATTSPDKLSVLENAGIKPYLVAVSENGISGDMASFLENSELLVLNIPPQLKGNKNASFVAKIEHLIAAVEGSSIKKILFVSSTSVYADDNQTVTEDSDPEPDSESGKQLLQAEQLLQNNLSFQTTILRFGGLIGPDRHPIRFLSGRKNIENPDAPINLIHLEDCIGIIAKIVANDLWNETFNAAAPFHPSRKEYYTQKAIALQLDLPEFDSDKPSQGKTILADKVMAKLDYVFRKKNL